MDICGEKTLPAGSTSLTFNNHHQKACNITGLNLPNASPAGPNYSVPGKSGSNPGTLTITFTSTAGRYPYTADCCPQNTQPVIIIQ